MDFDQVKFWMDECGCTTILETPQCYDDNDSLQSFLLNNGTWTILNAFSAVLTSLIFSLTNSHFWLLRSQRGEKRFCPVKSSSRIFGAEKNHVKDDLRANFELFIFTRNPQPISLKFLTVSARKTGLFLTQHFLKCLNENDNSIFAFQSYQEILNNI